jgi:hypothetical protein
VLPQKPFPRRGSREVSQSFRWSNKKSSPQLLLFRKKKKFQRIQEQIQKFVLKQTSFSFFRPLNDDKQATFKIVVLCTR